MLAPPPFSGARAYGYYSAELRLLVHRFKFSGRRDLVALFSPLMLAAFADWYSRADFDLVVAVPLHPGRRRERGFNQAALLARTLARDLGLPISETALGRTRSTQAQSGLSDAQRRLNVRGAFAVRNRTAVQEKHLLLVDDVMTTGATVASASRALLEAGALRVSVLTLARVVAGEE